MGIGSEAVASGGDESEAGYEAVTLAADKVEYEEVAVGSAPRGTESEDGSEGFAPEEVGYGGVESELGGSVGVEFKESVPVELEEAAAKVSDEMSDGLAVTEGEE